MNYKKLAIVSGAVLGMLSIILGAMAAHALESKLSVDALASFATGARYQMYQAFLLIIVGVMYRDGFKLLRPIIWLAIGGAVLFSGSIYLLVLTEGALKVGIVTPIGGLLMVAAWALLGWWALRERI